MKTIHLVIFLYVVLWSIFGCHQKESPKEPMGASNTIQVSVDDLENAYQKHLSDWVSDYRFLTLEVTEQSMLGNIDKIQFFEDKIFVMSRTNRYGVSVFDDKGKFLNSIGKKGRGPSEYLSLDGFAIDRYHHQIFLVDAAKDKLFVYDLNGVLIQEYPLKYGYSSVEVIDAEHLALICIGTESGYDLHITDFQGNVQHSYFPRSLDPYNGSSLLKPLILYGDTLLYMQQFNDTIYRITSNTVKPHTVVDYGDYRITQDKLIKSNLPLTWIPNVPCMSSPYFYTETSEFIHFLFTYAPLNEGPYHMLYNKKTAEKRVHANAYSSDFLDDLSFYPYGPRIIDVNTQTGEFVAYMEPYVMLKHYESLSRSKYATWDGATQGRYDSLKNELIVSLTEESNPVLMLLQFKNK